MSDVKIKRKLQQVIYRHRKRFIDDGLKRKPCNCKWNGAAKFPQGVSQRRIVRLCLYQAEDREQWNNLICDESLGGIQQASRCPYYQEKSRSEDLKAMFDSLLGLDGSKVEIGWVAKHYPDIAALTWVLGTQPEAEDRDPSEPLVQDPLSLIGNLEDVPEQPLSEDND